MSIVSKADLHVHTDASDGMASVRDVLSQAAALGLAVIAITDHDTIDDALEARRQAHTCVWPVAASCLRATSVHYENGALQLVVLS